MSAICRRICRRPAKSSAKPSLDLPADGLDLPALVAQIEKDMIDRALARTGSEQRRRGAAVGVEANDAGRETEADLERLQRR